MQVYWGVEALCHSFLTLAPVEVSIQLHAPAALPPGEKDLHTP